MIEKLYTIAETAKLIRFSERTVRDMIKSGKINRTLQSTPNGKRLVPGSAIAKFIENHTDTHNETTTDGSPK